MKTCKYKYNVYEFEIVYCVFMSVNIRKYRVHIYTHIYEYMYTCMYNVYECIVVFMDVNMFREILARPCHCMIYICMYLLFS